MRGSISTLMFCCEDSISDEGTSVKMGLQVRVSLRLANDVDMLLRESKELDRSVTVSERELQQFWSV
ncbi:hypothetical protein WICPIJ_009714 [Wickerhamomyces pijperi]|uniref:Uncharacterized protein n=1 Tax=Wickerhamomyces pijperi TaxID=599730 RepID=A0A9P8PKM6_WICPI|nr:hypothetical protein WICPIJ_009714 [Wickerhamomyces pijperi]